MSTAYHHKFSKIYSLPGHYNHWWRCVDIIWCGHFVACGQNGAKQWGCKCRVLWRNLLKMYVSKEVADPYKFKTGLISTVILMTSAVDCFYGRWRLCNRALSLPSTWGRSCKPHWRSNLCTSRGLYTRFYGKAKKNEGLFQVIWEENVGLVGLI